MVPTLDNESLRPVSRHSLLVVSRTQIRREDESLTVGGEMGGPHQVL